MVISRARTIRVPPAAVLALSVLLCGGGFAEPATAAMLLRHAEEASAAADPGRGGAGRTAVRDQRQAMTSLLSCLADAARQLQPVHDGPGAWAVAAADDALAMRLARLQGQRAPRPPRLVLHPFERTLPQHLDLPPPAATH